MEDENDEEDRTCYPIHEWYPPDMIIITAEEQKAFKDYAQKLLANPRSKIHKTMKCLKTQVNHTDFDIGQIDFDTSRKNSTRTPSLYRTSMAKPQRNLKTFGLTRLCPTRRLSQQNTKEMCKINK